MAIKPGLAQRLNPFLPPDNARVPASKRSLSKETGLNEAVDFREAEFALMTSGVAIAAIFGPVWGADETSGTYPPRESGAPAQREFSATT